MKSLLILSLLPSFVLGSYVDKKDIMGKEPRRLLVLCFLGGVVSTVTTLLVERLMSGLFNFEGLRDSTLGLFLYCLIYVALVEEGCKYFYLKNNTWKNKEYNHIYDAIVYSVFTSLGFATVENLLYVFSDGGGIITALIRAVISVPGHAFFAIFMGYYYGLAKQAELNNNRKLMKNNLLYALLVPVFLHGFFDFCLYMNSIVVFILFLCFVIFLYISSFKTVKRLSSITRNFEE